MTDEEIDLRGPMGGITYKGHGSFDIEGKDYHFHKVRVLLRQPCIIARSPTTHGGQPRGGRNRPYSALAVHPCSPI